jgi:superfamily II DNA/RNA helicase
MQQTTENFTQRLGFKQLNQMQQEILEKAPQQNNILLLSATGSGKTLGFLLPLYYNLKKEIKGPQALIIVPSRELALQIDEVWRKMQTGYKATLCYGGHKREIEETNLIEAPTLIIGTAGRLADHLRRNNFNTQNIETLILDEFDKSLEIGFLEEMKYVISACGNIQKRLLTSATFGVTLPDFVLTTTPFYEINFLNSKLTESLGLQYYKIKSNSIDKLQTLQQLLCFLGDKSSIIFCNHREAVERTSEYLKEQGIFNVFYHGGMEQRDREFALVKFKNGTSNYLVTTDLAARGLDIPYVRNIIHYHLPDTEANFTHRNGRTARMDASGEVWIIANENDTITQQMSALLSSDEINIKGYPLPEKTKWTTLFFAAGKKDKINKIDIVGFLSQQGKLKKEDIGLVDVKDFSSFAAIKKSKASLCLNEIKDQKIKGKKVKVDLAK